MNTEERIFSESSPEETRTETSIEETRTETSIDGTSTDTNTNSTEGQRTRKKTPIREYLEPVSDGGSICKLCRTKFGPKTATSTMNRHFEKNHISTHNQLRQRTLDVQRLHPYGPANQTKVDSINDAFLRWVIIDQQSFSLADNKYFRVFVTQLDPRYKPPCRQTLSQKINSEFLVKRSELKQYLITIPGKLSLTTDMWTSATMQPYLAITMHWIDSDWCMRKLLLDLVPFHDCHTGANQANTIVALLNEMEIGQKLLAVTTDNAANMVLMGRILKSECAAQFNNADVIHLRCAAHILNISVKAGIKYVSEEIKLARNFCKKLRDSSTLLEELKRIFTALDKPFLMPEIDCITRWNSTYLMLAKLTKIRDATDIVVQRRAELRPHYPDETNWGTIEDLMKILEPIYKATELLSSSTYPSQGDIRIVFIGLLRHLQDHSTNGNSQQTVASAIRTKLDEYWTTVDSTTYIGTILDPRYKLSVFEESQRPTIMQLLQDKHDEYSPSIVTPAPARQSNRDYFRNLVNNNANPSQSPSLANQVELYLTTMAEEDADPLLWWKCNSERYPVLARISRDYFAVQATSVPCEQVFSVAKHTASEVRNRIDPQTARAILCLKSWLVDDKFAQNRN
ncbi:7255_t:CDS:2 [Paraglomus occultum]|uniref:7255_t:CDS:1 n=1 Tax=Paraglomus occultum TaxID=144539 RepID=A0A9N9GEC9_9GLOM|nr:7255_t:CDS:2 [Paraglomus occultum]